VERHSYHLLVLKGEKIEITRASKEIGKQKSQLFTGRVLSLLSALRQVLICLRQMCRAYQTSEKHRF
jgi:hypothetical protein